MGHHQVVSDHSSDQASGRDVEIALAEGRAYSTRLAKLVSDTLAIASPTAAPGDDAGRYSRLFQSGCISVTPCDNQR